MENKVIIEKYKMEPEYVLGDDTNLQNLAKKISDDEEKLSKIRIECGDDYEVRHKNDIINHLSNLRLYNYLVLKNYLDRVINNELTGFVDYQKEDMKKHGWMFPLCFSNARIMTSGYVEETTEDIYVRNFHNLFDRLFDFNIGEKDSRIDRYYHEAIFNYKNEKYYSCVISLFPIIESYHQHMTNFNEEKFYRIKDNLSKVFNKIQDIRQVYSRQIKYYIELVKQFNDLIENHYFITSLSRTEEPEIINRNRLMHGLFSREVSQKDCLQLFCVISNMIVIKNIIDVNETITFLEKEIEELKTSL